MLKTKITKAEYDALSDELKKVYKQDGDSYLLQAEDAQQLRDLLATERAERKRLEDAAAEAKKASDEAAAAKKLAEEEAARELAKKNKDVEALEASWQAKVQEAKTQGEAAANKYKAMLENILVDSEADKLAAEISTVPALLKPIIKARLRAELDGEKPITRVLDANGNASAANLADLKQELVANKEFAAIIKAGNGSGGGANGNNSSSGAAGKKISEMTEAERVAHHRTVGAERFREQAKAEGLPVV
jgi:hypothetical protein